MHRLRSAIGCKRSVFAVGALLWLAGCMDDFSRFQFGQKKPSRPRDAGSQNVSDTVKNGARDGGAGANGPKPDAGPPARGERDE